MKHRSTTVLLLLLLVAMGLSYFWCDTRETSDLENRRLTTFDMVLHPVTEQDSEIYNENKTAADRFEDAMKDQYIFRDQVTVLYSSLEGKLSNVYNSVYLALNKPVPEEQTEEAVELDFEKYPLYGYSRLNNFSSELQYSLVSVGQGLYRANDTDWIVNAPTVYDLQYVEGTTFDISFQQIETISENYPDIRIYNYFVTHLNDTPWFDAYLGTESADLFEFITRYLPEEYEFAQLVYEDLEEYQSMFFKSDHHWTYLGAAQGYRDVYEMMADELSLSPIKEPIAEWDFTELYGVEYRGSRANKLRETYTAYDSFAVYEYDLGERKCYAIHPSDVDTEIPVTLTLLEQYKAGQIDHGAYTDHYYRFYGVAVTEDGTKYYDSQYFYKIETENETGHNLLIVGDSTQRVNRDVLASHFDTTIYLDYRIMSDVYIDVLIEKYDIDTILIGGLTSVYWYNSSSTFSFSPDFGQ